MTVAYALPTGDHGLVLWTPEPRFCLGTLKGLGDALAILSPRGDLNVKKIPRMSHDNIYRPTVRRSLSQTMRTRVGFLMIWGLIWLLGMDKPIEDVIGGLYLLIGLPMFLSLTIAVYKRKRGEIFRRYKNLFYAPTTRVVFSPRLARLEVIINRDGIIEGLKHLDELGFGHLREFYRRCAWSRRWKIGPPTGAGSLS
jgi:hypothetical protein